MNRRFDNMAMVYDKLYWKCTMSIIEIEGMYKSMDGWLSNFPADSYEWFWPPYSMNNRIAYNGKFFYPCICFETEEMLNQFMKRFGCLK